MAYGWAVRLWTAAGLVLSACAWAYDYGIKAAAPNLVKDADTALLVDFSGAAARVVAGPKGLGGGAVQGRFAADGGLSGTFRAPAAGVLNPMEWTVEMVLRTPADSATDLPAVSWEAKGEYRAVMAVSRGVGAALSVLASQNVKSRPHGFHLRASAGGNGHTIFRDAPGEWVYVAFGADLKGRRANVVVRGMDGHLLGKIALYAGSGGLNREFLSKIPEAQQAAAVEACWSDMLKTLRSARAETLTFGHEKLETRMLRVSTRFREDVLVVRPAQAGGEGAFTADKLDAQRARERQVERWLGYPGYRNEVAATVSERYVPLAAGDAPITLPLKGLAPGLYGFYVYGTVAREGRDKLERVWKPCPMAFEMKDQGGKVAACGRMLLKQGFAPRRMQGFFAHVVEPGDYTASFRLCQGAQEKAEILSIAMEDMLAGLPDEAVKSDQNLAKGKQGAQKTLTEQRLRRDEMIWNALPPLNMQLQVHNQVKEFRQPPEGVKATPWVLKAYEGIPGHYAARNTFSRLDFVNRETKQVLPHEKVIAGEPWPGELADDGTGIFFSRQAYPGLKHHVYYCPRAEALGRHIHLYLGLLGVWDHKALSLPKKYFETGNADTGHDAAVALMRVAYDWPAVEMNLHEIRLCTHAPDFEFNTDWSRNRNGKYFYDGWSGSNMVELLTAYDQIFPYIKDSQALADSMKRFIPWVQTPKDVIRFLDRYLVFAGVREFNKGLIRAAPVEDMAAQVLGPHRLTEPWFDLTRSFANIYPCKGTYQELYGTALPRNGAYYIGSFMVYAFGSAQDTIQKAHALAAAKAKGVQLRMDLSDVARYRKVKTAGDFLLDIFTAGGFPLTVGDASGGPHTGLEAEKRLRMAREASEQVFGLWQDPRHAWLLKNLYGSTDPEVARAAEGVKNPLLHQASRVVPNEAAVVELGSDETDVTRKSSMMLRLGIGQGHAHSDQLDLNMWSMGLPVSVDLACRSEGSNWSRPSASWSFLHNHAIASDDEDPRKAGGRSGEPWLAAFAPPLMRGRYVNQRGDETLARDVILMEAGEAGATYVFDVQRLRGGKLHTWCFHGCESEDVAVNAEMKSAEDVRWIDRLLEGTRKAGKAQDTLEAVWTMTRQGREYKHTFSGGGVVKTVPCEQAAMGRLYDPNLPPVRVRATLLGHGGADVLQGNPYSQQYAYCFPFLWVQAAAAEGRESVYPAVYEWYRGETPTVQKAQLVSREPLVVRVTTSSGQVDTFRCGEAFSAVSRDAAGLRWAKLSGGAELQDGDLSVKLDRPRYETPVLDVDYARGRLTTRDPLPADPHAVVGNPGRWSNIRLRGSGREFTFDDDVLIHEGLITSLKVTPPDRIEAETNQNVLFGDYGNRQLAGLTVTNEDATWHFRGGRAIKRPAGADLTKDVFTDANGDGLVNLKTYEFGAGDTAAVHADFTLRRTAEGYEVLTNTAAEVRLGGRRTVKVAPAATWQRLAE